MADLIATSEIPGSSVYGVKQMQYIVDGEEGKDYADALTAASFRQSVAIEEATAAFSSVVRLRERKVDDLSAILAISLTLLACASWMGSSLLLYAQDIFTHFALLI